MPSALFLAVLGALESQSFQNECCTYKILWDVSFFKDDSTGRTCDIWSSALLKNIIISSRFPILIWHSNSDNISSIVSWNGLGVLGARIGISENIISPWCKVKAFCPGRRHLSLRASSCMLRWVWRKLVHQRLSRCTHTLSEWDRNSVGKSCWTSYYLCKSVAIRPFSEQILWEQPILSQTVW